MTAGRWWSEVWEDSRAEEIFLDRINKIYRIKKELENEGRFGSIA